MATIFYRVGGGAEQSIPATYGQSVEIPGSAGQDVTFRVETDNQTDVFIAADASDSMADLFIILGQSNSAGRAPKAGSTSAWPAGVKQFDASDHWSDLAADDRLFHATDADKITNDDFSFARSFAQAYASENPDQVLYFVGAGDGGTGFATGGWVEDGPSYLAAVARINAAIAALPDDVTPALHFLWHQGENDNNGGAGVAGYQGNLDSLIARLRADVTGATAQTPFVAGGQFVTGSYWRSDDFRVQEATQALPNRVPYTGYAHPGVPDLFDNVHVGTEGTDAFGPRYATALARAVENTTVDPSTITLGDMVGFDLASGDELEADVDLGGAAQDRLVLIGLALRASGPHPAGVIYPERVTIGGIEAEHIVTPRRFSSAICATSIYAARLPAGSWARRVTVQTNVAATMAAGVALPAYGARPHLARVGGFAQLTGDVVGHGDLAGSVSQEAGDLVFGVGGALFPGGTGAAFSFDGTPQATIRQVAGAQANFSAYGAAAVAARADAAAPVALIFDEAANHPSATFCVLRGLLSAI